MKKLLLIVVSLFAFWAILTWCSAPSGDSAANDTWSAVALAWYMDYSDAALAKAESEDKKVAVFFSSKTCGSCGKLDADITANAANIPSDVVIMKADWDASQDLAKKFAVDKYHTVTMLSNWEKNVKWLFTLDDLVKEL